MEPTGAAVTTTTSTTSSGVIVQSSCPEEGIIIGLGSGITGLGSISDYQNNHNLNNNNNNKTPLRSNNSTSASAAAQSSITTTTTTSSTSAATSPVLSPPGKTFGKNNNGTMVVTSTPSNDAELQLYRVLQRASLLAYYDTLLEMGGDDVQQLCDAGEEEFLEIMALVGMASKPLHVRRLQKSLHEWMTNPSLFQSPLSVSADLPRSTYSPEPGSVSRNMAFSATQNYIPSPSSSTNNSSISNLATNLANQISTNTIQMNPTLTDNQISRIVGASERLVKTLPQLEPKQHNSKKRSSRELERVIAMSDSDPRRMDEIRKYSAIYGRFDCKRRPEKPLTLHEVCVNEAAAQICKYIPGLLTRRDELFPLARQVVRDSGFGHSASIRLAGMSQMNTRNDELDSSNQHLKRSRLSSDTSSDLGKDNSDDMKEGSSSTFPRMDKPFDLSDTTKYSYARSDFDDADSRFSFSNSSSSPDQGTNGMDRDITDTELTEIRNEFRQSSKLLEAANNQLGVQVISASGNHIIAVANPALALSPALSEAITVKREVISPDLH